MERLHTISPAVWYNLGLIVVIVGMLVMIVVAHRAWTEAHEDVEPVSASELLASFEQAREDGELDDEEYQRVRDRLRRGEADAGSKSQSKSE